MSPERGAVDLLAAADPGRRAFTRMLPNGRGSECTFTLFFPADTDEATVARQVDVVTAELQAVRNVCEQRA